MTFQRFNLHQVWTPSGQKIGYADVPGKKQAWLNFSRVEFVGPALYTPTAPREIGPGSYALVIMESGVGYVVDGGAPAVADEITGAQPLKKIWCEKAQLVNGQMKVYSGGAYAWLAPALIESVDDVDTYHAGYKDGVARANILGRSGTLYQAYGVQSRTIATTRYWDGKPNE